MRADLDRNEFAGILQDNPFLQEFCQTLHDSHLVLTRVEMTRRKYEFIENYFSKLSRAGRGVTPIQRKIMQDKR